MRRLFNEVPVSFQVANGGFHCSDARLLMLTIELLGMNMASDHHRRVLGDGLIRSRAYWIGPSIKPFGP